ncbi:MAG: glucose-6-phosphate isomerase [Archaeoglobi archaeon]|nr:glucose-6-phosphate isomerase [Archaeoglobi archaeon]
MKPLVNFEELTPAIRFAEDLKPVLYQPDQLRENFPAYYMYRDCSLSEEDARRISELGLRYDYTIIPPARIGEEFIKTYGHYHPIHREISYPELYQVIEGRAVFLLQKRGEREDELLDFIAVEVKEGEMLLVPPDYGHVMVNPSDERLVTSNWVCRSFQSLYEPYARLRGAGYYLTTNGWAKNRNYRKLPEVREGRSAASELFDVDGEMYHLIEKPELLEMLTDPEKHREVFERVLDVD